MRPLSELDAYRDEAWELHLQRLNGGDLCPKDLGGCFILPFPRTPVQLRCIAANDEGWDHVSVSTSVPRCPTWEEMEHVKRTFFRPDETAFQLHVPPADHISHHPYCLHIWRPHAVQIPLPPSWMIA